MGGILGRQAWARSNGGLWLPEVYWSPVQMGFCCCTDGCEQEDVSGIAYTCEFLDELAPTYCIWQWGSYPWVLALQLCVDPVDIPTESATLAFYQNPGSDSPSITYLYNTARPADDCFASLDEYVLDQGLSGVSAEVIVP